MPLARKMKNHSGQSTVEYAIVLAAFLAVVMGLGALSNLFTAGTVVDHALLSASHHIGGDVSSAVLDIFSF